MGQEVHLRWESDGEGLVWRDKVMSLLLNMLSRLVITVLPRSKRLSTPLALLQLAPYLEVGMESVMVNSMSQLDWAMGSPVPG